MLLKWPFPKSNWCSQPFGKYHNPDYHCFRYCHFCKDVKEFTCYLKLQQQVNYYFLNYVL